MGKTLVCRYIYIYSELIYICTTSFHGRRSIYLSHMDYFFYEIHETFKEIHIMVFHCNKYPYTIKHRVFFKTFCENIFKRRLLEILPDTYDSSNGVL